MSGGGNFTQRMIEIIARNAAYAAAIDAGKLAQWVEMFTEDGLYLAQPRENADRGLPLATIRCEGRGMLADRVHAIEKTMVFAPRYVRHLISAPQVFNVSATEIHCVSNFLVTQTLTMQPTQIMACGEYRDRWRIAENGAHLLAARIAVFDSELVPNSLIYPL
jgi:3-phenylpropionate/cinnamic acid dioxygenase small subunit